MVTLIRKHYARGRWRARRGSSREETAQGLSSGLSRLPTDLREEVRRSFLKHALGKRYLQGETNVKGIYNERNMKSLSLQLSLTITHFQYLKVKLQSHTLHRNDLGENLTVRRHSHVTHIK